jgi:hypothetical protein
MLSHGANQKDPRIFYRILNCLPIAPAGYKNKNPYVLYQQNLYQWSDEQMILGIKWPVKSSPGVETPYIVYKIMHIPIYSGLTTREFH